MKRLLCAIALCAALPLALPAAGPNPDKYYVASISYGGTGCPQGTVGQTISSARLDAVLGFDGYVASTGPGVPISEATRSCQVNVNLHVPAGPASATIHLETRSYAQLPAGYTAEINSLGYFAGEPIEGTSPSTLAGPVASMYSHVAEFPISSDLEAAGTIPFNVNTAARIVNGTTAKAQLTSDYLVVRVSQE